MSISLTAKNSNEMVDGKVRVLRSLVLLRQLFEINNSYLGKIRNICTQKFPTKWLTKKYEFTKLLILS